MLLLLSDEHKEHLSFLTQVDAEGKTSWLSTLVHVVHTLLHNKRTNNSCSAVVKEFCRISLEFIRKGTNPRVYQTAARTLVR